MKNKLSQISIILISYNSSKKLIKFIDKIPKETPILIIDNSKDLKLKKIFRNKKNVSVYFKKNMGYGSSINFAAKKINTKYFFVIQPDVRGINKKALITFSGIESIGINNLFSTAYSATKFPSSAYTLLKTDGS